MAGEGRFESVAIAISENLSLKTPSYLGAGAFKEAYLTKNSSEDPVTLKVFNPDKCNLCRAEREIAAMQQCQSSLIGKLYNWGKYENTDGNEYLFILEEYLAGGTLLDRMPSARQDVKLICNYGLALISAISHLRDKALVHRDIKPDNIMFRGSNDEVPVLVDFGLVRDLTGTSLTHSFLQQGPGTPFFASPEQLNNDKSLIDWRSDQFSIGVVLSLCLTGIHPYQVAGQNEGDTVDRVGNRSQCSEQFSERANEVGCGFLVKMVSPWPVDRFSKPDLIIHELMTAKGGT